MLKNTVESIIEKYYLNGLVEAVRMGVENKNAVITFNPTDDKSLIGKVTCKNFDVSDCSIGIYNTSQLIKLIKILDHNISLTINQERSIADKILISDNKYDLEYYLAELNLIKPTPKIKEPEYEIDIDLKNDDFMTKFTNARKALGDIRQFSFEANQLSEKTALFELGDGTSYSNKIKFSTSISSDFSMKATPFSANLLNEVFLANKRCVHGNMKISSQGLIKISFQEGDLDSTYFLIRLEDI